MTRTFQNCAAEEIRRARRSFLVDAGIHVGRPVTEADLEAFDQLDDATALACAFPELSASERTELLWALRVAVRSLATHFWNHSEIASDPS